MAVFVDLEDEDTQAPDCPRSHCWSGNHDSSASCKVGDGDEKASLAAVEVREDPNRNLMSGALGCYPIVMALAESIDLNTLDSLARTCRGVRDALLQYRIMLRRSTLHCSNDKLPIDPGDTLRYRARAGNWFYMEDAAGTNYCGKSGQCARDMVGGCRRCGTVVCRNCVIKPPARLVLRERHRRLCAKCTKAPLGMLVKPPLDPDTALNSEHMQRAICRCAFEGVWLCQPCGRSIRSDDSSYRSIWRWRHTYCVYGLSEGDHGVICGCEGKCLGARDCEQETDGAGEAGLDGQVGFPPATSAWSLSSLGSIGSNQNLASPSYDGIPIDTPGALLVESHRRTPSPGLLGPGFERHEVEGIGGVLKTINVRMVKVGACVSEWEDEREDVLGREVKGVVRSWCGWCWRVVPGKKDVEAEKQRQTAVTALREI